MKDVQCYKLFGGIALKNHAFSFSFFHLLISIPTSVTDQLMEKYVNRFYIDFHICFSN